MSDVAEVTDQEIMECAVRDELWSLVEMYKRQRDEAVLLLRKAKSSYGSDEDWMEFECARRGVISEVESTGGLEEMEALKRELSK